MGLSSNLSFIPEKINQDHINDPRFQKIFSHLCYSISGLEPEFILDTSSEGNSYIIDSKLYLQSGSIGSTQIIDPIRVIHKEAFGENIHESASTEKLLKTAQYFVNTSKLLNEYIKFKEENPHNSRDESELLKNATLLSEQFAQYGLGIQMKEEASTTPLSEEEKDELDLWLLGYESYTKRNKRKVQLESQKNIDKSGGSLNHGFMSSPFTNFLQQLSNLFTKEENTDSGGDENTLVINDTLRYKRLDAFFRIFLKTNGESLHIQERIKFQIERALSQPLVSLYDTVLKVGKSNLVSNIQTNPYMVNKRASLSDGEDFIDRGNLYESLDIDSKKKELAQLRIIGNIDDISAKEIEFSKDIWKAVSSYLYTHDNESYMASSIFSREIFNCLGSTQLGGAFLEELGINYVHANSPSHTFSLLVTSDGKIYMLDFTPGTIIEDKEGNVLNYVEITSDMCVDSPDFTNILEKTEDRSVQIEFKDWNPYKDDRGKLIIDIIHPSLGKKSDILWNEASRYLDLGDDEKALYTLETALLFDSDDQTKLLEITKVMLKRNKIGPALKYSKILLSKHPKSILGYDILAKIYKQNGEQIKSDEAYSKMLELTAKNLDEYQKQIDFLIEKGENGKVELLLHAMYKSFPDNFMCLVLMVTYYKAIGKFDDAHKCYDTLIDTNPYNTELYYSKGELYMREDKYIEAAPYFKSAIEVNPHHEFSIYRLILCCQRDSNIGDLKTYLELYINNIGNSGAFIHQVENLIDNIDQDAQTG